MPRRSKIAVNLTEKNIRAIPTPATGHIITWDEKESRFGLRTTSTGEKAFIIEYLSKHPGARGKDRRYTIGRWPVMNTTRARDRVRELKVRIAEGDDPLETRQAYSESITLGELMREYAEKELIKQKTGKDSERFIEKEILRLGASRKAADIKKSDVRYWFEAKTATAPVAANKMLALLRRIFNWGNKRDLFGENIVLNPTTGIDLNKENPSLRYLNENEIKDFLERVDGCWKLGQSVADALRLTLFTAQRSGEVVEMDWDEVDLGQKIWKQPAEKTKNETLNIVPLNSLAIEILEKRKANRVHFQEPGESRVFPGLSQKSLARALNRQDKNGVYVNRHRFGKWCEQDPFTPHSLRHTAITQLHELGVDRLVISKIVNHKDRTITGHYDHAERTKEKRQAVEKWDRTLRNIMTGETQKVVSIG
jgi:integrase